MYPLPYMLQNKNNNPDTTLSDYSLQLANPTVGKRIWTIMNEVYTALPDKSLFCCDEYDFVMDILTCSGFGVIASTNNTPIKKEDTSTSSKSANIVASLLVKFPRLAEENLGYDIGLEKEELYKVAHLESVVVLPKHRGHGLQGKLISFAEQQIDKTQYSYLMATVSPDNLPSLHTFQKNGYEIIKVTEKYGGLKRCILLKNHI